MNTLQQSKLRTEIEQLTKIEAEIDRLQRRKEVIRSALREAVLLHQSSTLTKSSSTPTQTSTLELAVPSAGVTLKLTTSTTKRIDTTRLKSEMPDIAAMYTKLILREQLTVKIGLPIPAIPQPDPDCLVKEQEVR